MDTDKKSEDDDITDSALVDESNSERNSSSGSVVLKKGPWSEEEDDILKDYVEKHGQGNWNAVQRFSGLSRCGKSCRLRWLNHLRPDLKKGPFSPEEERKVIELHAKHGNKWSRMTPELPGRTDNDIKNMWNTRCKRLQRAGLPIYPPDVVVERQTENQQSPETPPFSNGSICSSHGFMDTGYDDIEQFKIAKNPILRSNSSPAFLDDPLLNMLQQVPQPNLSYSLSNMFSAIHPQGPVPADNSNYMSVPFNPQGLDTYRSSNHIYPTIGPSDQVQESGIPYNGLTSGSFTAQSNRVPILEDVQLPPRPHELSTTNGIYLISDDPAPSCNASTHADINKYSLIEPSYESTLLELPSIQNSVSDLSFMGHIPPPPPQAGLSTLQSVAATHQESTGPAVTMADEFLNDPLEADIQHDDLPDFAPNVPVTVDDILLVESYDDVLLAGTDLVPRPTVTDSYQLGILAVNEWFDGSGPEYALLDQAMSAFINDEEFVTLTSP